MLKVIFIFLGELEMWNQKWKTVAAEGIKKCPDNDTEDFSCCDADVFPNIKLYL